MIESATKIIISPNLAQFLPLYRKYPTTTNKIPNIEGNSMTGCEKTTNEYIDASNKINPAKIDIDEIRVTTIGTL